MLNVGYEYVRNRKMDGFGLLVLSGIVFTMLVSLTSGDERFALVKESFFGAAFRLLCLSSYFARKPLMFYFARKFGSDGGDIAIAQWNEYWEKSPGFRRGEYVITGAWALFSLAQAAAVVIAAYSTLSSDSVASISSISSIAVSAALIFWSIWYGRSKLKPLTQIEVRAYDHALAART